MSLEWSDLISFLGWFKSIYKRLFSKPNLHIEILDKKAENIALGTIVNFYLILEIRISNISEVATKITDCFLKYNNKIANPTDEGRILSKRQIEPNDYVREIIYFRFDPKEYRTIIESKINFTVVVKEVTNIKKQYSLKFEPPIPKGQY